MVRENQDENLNWTADDVDPGETFAHWNVGAAEWEPPQKIDTRPFYFQEDWDTPDGSVKPLTASQKKARQILSSGANPAENAIDKGLAA